MSQTSTGILLAAGQGTRLLPLTKNVSKPAVEVGGQPLVAYAAKAFAQAGFEDLIVVTKGAGREIQSILGDGSELGLRIRYIQQGPDGGTMGAVKAAATQVDGDAVICYGNAWFGIDALMPMQQAGARVLLGRAHSGYLQGLPKVSGGKLKGMEIKPARIDSDMVFAGVARLDAAAVAAAVDSDYEHIEEFLGRYSEHNEIATSEIGDSWVTVDDAWSLLSLNERILLRDAQQIEISDKATIAPTARVIPPVIIEAGASVEDFSIIGPCVVLGQNSKIGAYCKISTTMIGDNAAIGDRSTVQASIISDGAIIEDGVNVAVETDDLGARGCVVPEDGHIVQDARVPGGTIFNTGRGK